MAFIDKNKKSAAFEKLYFENYTSLCRRIYRFVRDEDITRDIVQEVFLKYWQKIHDLHIHESAEAYLYRSCVNQALNYLKEKERRESREQSYVRDIKPTDNNSPDDKIIADQTSADIDETINRLTPACRNAFLLSRYEQKSYKEIADLLSISVNTVEKHIGKALKAIRKNLGLS